LNTIDWLACVTVRTVEPVTPLKVAVMLLVPTLAAVANPPDVMVATLVVTDAHVTWLVRFAVLASLYVPVAVNCCVSPFAMDGFASVTEIDCKVAGVTVSNAEPTTDPEVALMVLVPTATAVAEPLDVMVATLAVTDAHVTWLVRLAVLASLYVPVAVNCCVKPFAMDGLAGVTEIDCSAACVTVNTVKPTIDPNVALMVLSPVAMAVANPPAVMVAVAVVPDPHVTDDVTFAVLVSL
jgi:hypothetical protein